MAGRNHVRKSATLALLAVAVAGCSQAASSGGSRGTSSRPGATATAATSPMPGVLFDDLSYATTADMVANGWIVRTKPGQPGVVGAVFDPGYVAVVDDATEPGNRMLELAATTDGTSTRQSEVCQQRKYREGTFAARLYFSDAPASGPDGDEVIEAFNLTSPAPQPTEQNYSEIDNTYLPNGGFANPEKTYRFESWAVMPANGESDPVAGEVAGWHTVMAQVAGHETRFYLDGRLVVTHGSQSYPTIPMAIDFSLWFIPRGFVDGAQPRTYHQDVDWVYASADKVESTDEVTAAVARMRAGKTAFNDGIPTLGLESPCNL
jgi:hypothetical protein